MKILIIAAMALTTTAAYSQPDTKDIQKFKKQAVKDYPGVSLRHIQFMVDTFTIEKTMQSKLDEGRNMKGAIADVANEYDKLLNQTYKELQTVLTVKGKALLTTTEKAWLTFEENEIKFWEELHRKDFETGGEIIRLDRAMFMMELLKSRVISIEDYREYQPL